MSIRPDGPFRDRRLAWALCLLVTAAPALAQRAPSPQERPHDFKNTPSDPGDDWKEGGFKIPAYPRDGDLVTLDSNILGLPYRYLIDRTSLTRSEDGVIRYSIVIESPGGARNVFFEGMRCTTMEVRTYAYGQPGQGFRPFQSPRWNLVEQRGPLAYRHLLANYLLCDQFGLPMRISQIREVITQTVIPKDVLGPDPSSSDPK